MARPDVIAIEGLVVDCVVGVYPHERDTPQPLRVDLYMEVDTRAAGQHERLREHRRLRGGGRAGDVPAQGLPLSACSRPRPTRCRALLAAAPPALGERRAQIEALRLRLTKPFALSGLRGAVRWRSRETSRT